MDKKLLGHLGTANRKVKMLLIHLITVVVSAMTVNGADSSHFPFGCDE